MNDKPYIFKLARTWHVIDGETKFIHLPRFRTLKGAYRYAARLADESRIRRLVHEVVSAEPDYEELRELP